MASNILDGIRSEEWRHDFVRRLSSLDGFDELLGLSCQTADRDLGAKARAFPHLNSQSQEIISAYDKQDLVAARQYYNNEHLVEFWRYYRNEVDAHISAGKIDRDFPLFNLSVDIPNLSYQVTSIALKSLQDTSEFKAWKQRIEMEGSPYPKLHILFAKLSVLTKYQFRCFFNFYGLFLQINKKKKSPIWDYYKIHYFLDNNLYGNGSSLFFRTPFEFAFFSNNLTELTLYLEHEFGAQSQISLDSVDAFLQRQRDYYLKLALTITLEENEIHNRRKDLRMYEPREGIVKEKVTEELREFYRITTVDSYGLLKQNGCPFARTKGLGENALLEVFEYFDRMMIYLLGRSPEFDDLFAGRERKPETFEVSGHFTSR